MPSFVTTIIRMELGEEVEVEVECEYEYEAGEPQTYDSPGCSPACQITQVNDLTTGLTDIGVSEFAMQSLERKALEQHEPYQPEYERD